MSPARNRIPDEIRVEVVRLARTGLPRNQVADKAGVSRVSVSRICAEHGISFDRSATAAATAAKVIDFKAKRQALSEKFLERANGLLDEMNAAFMAYSFGGRDNDYSERLQPSAPPGDKRSLMQAATYALNAHLAIEAKDGDKGIEGAKSMLGALAAGIEAAARELEASGVTLAE